MDHILYQIFKITLNISYKHETLTDNPSIMIYGNKIEIIIMFKIKRGYYLQFLTSQTTKLLGSTTSKITKDKNGENVPHFKITEVVLIQSNIVKNNYPQDSRTFICF